MKASVIFALIFVAVPLTVSAQTVAPAPAASPASAMGAEMSAGFALMSQTLRTQLQARTSMLAALTPVHRALVAQVVGELAVSPEPNFDAAAARLDAALSPGEVQALGRVEAAKRGQSMAEMGQLQTTLRSTMSPDQLQTFEADAAKAARTTAVGIGIQSEAAKMARAEADPGHVLLQTVLFGVQPFARMLDTLQPRIGGP